MNKVGIHLFSTHEDSTNNLARMYSSPIEMKSPLGESFYFPCKHETMKTFDKYSNCKNCGVFMNQVKKKRILNLKKTTTKKKN